jgi:uncharacterized membrane protein
VPGNEESRASPLTRARDRIESISDAVFAIALTLLTLNVSLTLTGHETFAHAFHETLPEIFAFALSFTVIALFWIAHHRFFATLQSVDHRLILFNFAYLGVIALIPFPSDVIGTYGDEPGAVILYASTLILLALISALMWEYALRRELYLPDTSVDFVRQSEWRALSLAIVFALSIPVAVFISTQWAELTWILIAPARALLKRRYGPIHDMVW